MKKTLVIAAIAALVSSSALAGEVTSLASNLDGWAGSVEGGLDLRNGNTKQKDLHVKGAVSRSYGQWKHTLSAEALNQETSNVRTSEKYRAGWNTDYAINDRLFAFGEADWVKDRFSGYKYRTDELAGLGYHIIKSDNFIWDARAGVGLEQVKTELGDSSNDALAKIGTFAEYKFNDSVSLTETAEALFTSELQTYRSETAVKSKIAEHLAFKAGYAFETLSDVPAGRDKTDSYTFLSAVYDF
jgi:putative salt-induced outer membrane protein